VIVDHIDHMVKVAGIDHVGIGSDFDGIGDVPEGMEDVSKLPAIRAELKRRGYSDDDVRKVMGENFMRVFGEVEKIAKGLQTKEPAAAPEIPSAAK
jgi:membrane dipeptidase